MTGMGDNKRRHLFGRAAVGRWGTGSQRRWGGRNAVHGANHQTVDQNHSLHTTSPKSQHMWTCSLCPVSRGSVASACHERSISHSVRVRQPSCSGSSGI